MTLSEAQKPFSLVLAKEKVRQAEARHKHDLKALETTKSRAATLLGWCVSLTAAFAAASTQVPTIEKFGSLLGALIFVMAALLCIGTLYSTKVRPATFKPDDLDTICEEFVCEDEPHFSLIYAGCLNEIIEQNEEAINADQKKLRSAWIISAIASVVILLSFFVGALF